MNNDNLSQIKEAIMSLLDQSVGANEKVKYARLEQENRYEWYATLLGRIEALEEKSAKYREASDRLMRKLNKSYERAEALEHENAAIRETLEWYRDGSEDGGERARDVLASLSQGTDIMEEDDPDGDIVKSMNEGPINLDFGEDTDERLRGESDRAAKQL